MTKTSRHTSMGTDLGVRSETYLMNTKMTGFR